MIAPGGTASPGRGSAPTMAATALSPAPVVLHPGDVAILDRGQSLETLLGSCVSIVLTDPRRSSAAACHVVHACDGPEATHGPFALARMFAGLRARGIEPLRCLAWVAGGGHMFPQLRGEPRLPDVGQANARWALRTLQGLGIALQGHDVGGSVYRRLRWTVGSEPPCVTAVKLEAAS